MACLGVADRRVNTDIMRAFMGAGGRAYGPEAEIKCDRTDIRMPQTAGIRSAGVREAVSATAGAAGIPLTAAQ